jgi:hypothetical protein
VSHDRDAVDALMPRAAEAWRQCALCWGQRRIWQAEEARNGEGRVLVARPCEQCLGVGEVVRP